MLTGRVWGGGWHCRGGCLISAHPPLLSPPGQPRLSSTNWVSLQLIILVILSLVLSASPLGTKLSSSHPSTLLRTQHKAGVQ